MIRHTKHVKRIEFDHSRPNLRKPESNLCHLRLTHSIAVFRQQTQSWLTDTSAQEHRVQGQEQPETEK